jgi:hypothetical protein
MANQQITQLPIASSASTGDVIYIVNDYTPESTSLTGDSKQIYFSAISQAISATIPELSNNVDNAVVTATGTSPALTGESNLTFDGTNLNLTGTTTVTGKGTFGSLQIGAGSTITATTTATVVSVRKIGNAPLISSGATVTLTGLTSNYLIQRNWGEWSSSGLTATKPAIYRVSVYLAFGQQASTVTGNTGGQYWVSINKNGTDIIKSIFTNYNTTNIYRYVKLYGIVSVLPGDTIRFRAYQDGTSIPISNLTNGAYQQFSVEELPNILIN